MKQVQSFRGIPHYRIDVIRSYYMDEEHLNKAKGGWGHKMGINLCIYHPINLHGGEFRFVNLFNQGIKLWQRQT